MNNYRVAFRLADAYGKEKRGYLASSRIRGHYLSKYWDECDDCFYPEEFLQYEGDFFNPINQMKVLRGYNVVILNKTYEHKLAKLLQENNQIVIIDMCDPDHLSSHSSKQRKSDCLKTMKYADLIVVNSEELKKSVREVYKSQIEIIPDRIDLDSCQPQKEKHNETFRKIVWYGYSENLRVLEPYLKDIVDMGLEITIISDKFFENFFLVGCKHDPKELITFQVWRPERINKQIINRDAVFIGKDPDPYLSKFKSDNRANLGYALGMPVAFDIKDLKSFWNCYAREYNAKKGQYRVRRYFDIRHSVSAYNKIIKKLIKEKK